MNFGEIKCRVYISGSGFRKALAFMVFFKKKILKVFFLVFFFNIVLM